jgi:hypothetical protein
MRKCLLEVSLVAATLTSLAWIGPGPGHGVARGATLYTQPYDGTSPGTPSQVFTDISGASTKSFDDFVVTGGSWLITQVTIFGMEQGNPSQNVSVRLQFPTTANFSDPAPTFTGVEDANGNLVFSNLNVLLTPGTHLISAWVTRPELPTGGQWFWSETLPVHGNEYIIHNPGGIMGFGTSPIPGSQLTGTAEDLAFTLVGSVVPEPSSLVLALIAVGTMGIAWWCRWRGLACASLPGRPRRGPGAELAGG